MKHKTKIIILIIFIVTLAVIYIMKIWLPNYNANKFQNSIQSFYDVPSPLPQGTPGTLIRTEPMNISVPSGGTAYKIMYISQLPDGAPAISSGMIFIPNSTAPANGRKVVAWAHGTLGFGNECVPSRSQNPLGDTTNWLDGMMQRGWVVVATDYTGLGTSGSPYYLIGKSEANDVINSVRAARNFDASNAGTDFIVWGHSQGGHSSLFTGVYANTYAPELKLIAVAAAAPAAELNALFSEQYNKVVSWAIGPDASVSWPLVYPNLPLDSVLTKKAIKNFKSSAYGCVMKELGELELKSVFKEQFFQIDPMTNSAWFSAASAETPPVSEIKVPIYIAQGLEDTVVLPNTTALLVEKACTAGKNITVDWLGNTTHTQAAVVSGPSVVAWMQDRFNNIPAANSCTQSLPIAPATEPSAPTN